MLGRPLSSLAFACALAMPLGAQQPQPPQPPMVLDVPRATIVIIDPAAAAMARGGQHLAGAIAQCRTTIPLTAEDSVRLVSAPLLESATDEAASHWPIVVVATEAATSARACRASRLAHALAAARGIFLAGEAAPVGLVHPTRVALIRNDLVVPGQRVVVRTQSLITAAGVHASDDAVAAMTFDLSLLAPSSRGLPTDLRVAVWTPVSETPLVHPLPLALLREIWDRASPARFAETAARNPEPESQGFAVPRPRDAVLAHAQRQFAAGEVVEAATVSISRLRDRDARLRRDDRLAARMQIGLSALARGDTALARVHFEQAKRVEPCVRLANVAPESARRLLDALPVASGACNPSSLARTLLRGIALPGFGHRADHRRPWVGVAAVGVLGGVAATAVQRDRVASEQYERYLRIVPGANDHAGGAEAAIAAYDRAEGTRVASVRVAQAAVVLWGASVVDAFLSERRFRNRLGLIQQYGRVTSRDAARSRWVAPHVSDRGVGFAVGVF